MNQSMHENVATTHSAEKEEKHFNNDEANRRHRYYNDRPVAAALAWAIDDDEK